MNNWKQFYVVLCFAVSFLVVCTVAAAVAGRSPSGIVLALAGLGILLAVWAVFLKNKEWKLTGLTYALAIGLGLGAGVLLVGGMMVLCSTQDPNNTPLGAQTIVLVLQTLVLAATLLYVYKYVVAAQKSAVAAVVQVEVARCAAVGAALFVSDPILTVQQFAKEHKVHDVLEEKWGDVADDRLMIEITNEGVGAAMNLDICADWEKDGWVDKVEAKNVGWMPSTPREEGWNDNSLFFGKAPWVPSEKRKPWENGLSQDAWRIWRLGGKRKALLYFTEPDREKKHTLQLRWYDVFYRREPFLNIKVVWHKGHWYTDWGDAAQLWQARCEQMIRQMEKITEEIGK